MDCTKFVEFLKSFVKLLVLNESRPLDVTVEDGGVAAAATVDDDDDDDEDDDGTFVDVAFAFGGKVGSALPRTDLVLWLNIILTFSHL